MNRMLLAAVFCLLAASAFVSRPAAVAQAGGAVVTVRNELDLARPIETVVLAVKEITCFLTVDDPRRVHVRDAISAKEMLVQAVDLTGDSVADELVFQADLGPRETKEFSLFVGDRQIPSQDQFKVYGRFVRERFDDFAWENDRVAHRMYGTALESWEREPLTSSTVDVWCKRVRKLVINDWYMVDDYHEDRGEGADFYSAGRSRGCGGSGLWDAGKLWVSRNFVDSRVLANGPIRLVFELVYAPWQVNGRDVSEVKRITLDAGQNLNHFESFYRSFTTGPLVFAAGIKKDPASTVASDKVAGLLRTWEPIRKGQSGNLGCGIIMDPSSLVEITEADGNYLMTARTDDRKVARYHAGSTWDRGGDFADVNAWTDDLARMSRRLRSPLKVTIAAK